MKNPKVRLTKRLLESGKLTPLSGQVEIYDDLVQGFGVRVTHNRVQTFFIAYRLTGKPRRFTIGRWPECKVSRARGEAEAARGLIRQGRDPEIERLAQAAATEATRRALAQPTTVGLILDEYLTFKREVDQLRSIGELERLFKLHVRSRWGKLPLKEIDRATITRLLDDMRRKKLPVQANRVLAALKTFFGWATQRGYITSNPAADVDRPTRETSRARVLTDDELLAVWNACDSLSPACRSAFRLLIVCGQRRTESCSLMRSELDLERKIWIIPPEKAKNGRAHEVPLSDLAIGLIASAPKFDEDGSVFSTAGKVRINQFVKPKVILDRISKVSDWTLHDLRRTVATGLERLGVLPHVADLILNHTPEAKRGVSGVYLRYDYASEKREALDRWAQHLLGLLARGSKNVVPFRSSGSAGS